MKYLLKGLLALSFFTIAMSTQGQKRTVVMVQVIGAPVDSFSTGFYMPDTTKMYKAITPYEKEAREKEEDRKYVIDLKAPTTKALIGTEARNPVQEYSYLTKVFLFLRPGDSLSVSYDIHHQNSTIQFKGRAGTNNKILYEFNRIEPAAFDNLNFSDSTTPNELMVYTRNVKMSRVKLLNQNQKRISPALLKYLETKTKLDFVSGLLGVPMMLNAYFHKEFSKSIPDGYWSFSKLVKIDEHRLKDQDYVALLSYTYPYYLLLEQQHANNVLDKDIPREKRYNLMYSIANKTYKNPTVKSVVLAEILKSLLGATENATKYRNLLDDYLSNYCKSVSTKQSLLAFYEKRASLAVGQVPPSFPMEDMQGNKITLAKFKGKVVYMDFWASWCSPCRYEMKEGAPGLFKKFRDKDVVFLDVSIDDSLTQWKQAVKELNIDGLQVLSKGGFDSPAAGTFNIEGIPHYILIGRDGKIFNNNATRPTQAETVEAIEKLLKQENE